MKRKNLILALLIIVSICLIFRSFRSSQTSSEIDKIMNADKAFSFPPSFPSDPGEAGKKTLGGIDSDHDGIRDDVQRWIYARFPNEPKKRSALRQMAIVFQRSLFIHHNQDEMMKENEASGKAITCINETFGNYSNEMELVRAKVLNTRERIKRYLEVDRWYDGMTLGPSYPRDGTACEE